MIIAIINRFFPAPYAAGDEIFTRESFLRLAAQFPRHNFFFISDHPAAALPVTAPNVKHLVIGNSIKTRIGLKFWYEYRLPTTLKKIQADVLINADGTCSLRAKTPQLLLLNYTGFLSGRRKEYKKINRYYKKNSPDFLKKATLAATFSPYAATAILEKNPAEKSKLKLLIKGIDPVFQPVSREQKEAVKERHTGGKEYFLFRGDIDPANQIISLLKAFSLFKKRQKTNMQLLLLSPGSTHDTDFMEELKTYKYRDEVILITATNASSTATLLASAYAYIQPFPDIDFAAQSLEAMQAEVPVICSTTGAAQSLLEESALYGDPKEPQQLANAMMLVFKDEDERSRLIAKGKKLAARYTPGKSAALLWETILETANQ